MKAEEVIVRMAGTAPGLSNVGVRLMLHVVATAIETGNPEVILTSRGAAASMGISQDGMRHAVRNLARVIPAQTRDRQLTMFRLSSDWYSEQMRLPLDADAFPQVFRCTEKPGTRALKTQARCTENPGSVCTENPGTLPGKSVQDCGNQGSRAWEISAACTENPGTDSPLPLDHPRARVDRSIDQGLSSIEALSRIDRAFHTVKILPRQVEAARILRDLLADYRRHFPNARAQRFHADEIVIARCLAIADVEDLGATLAALRDQNVEPGFNDMWFFALFCNKLLGIHRKEVSERIAQLKSKAPSDQSEPTLFHDELVSGTIREMRKLG